MRAPRHARYRPPAAAGRRTDTSRPAMFGCWSHAFTYIGMTYSACLGGHLGDIQGVVPRMKISSTGHGACASRSRTLPAQRRAGVWMGISTLSGFPGRYFLPRAGGFESVGAAPRQFPGQCVAVASVDIHQCLGDRAGKRLVRCRGAVANRAARPSSFSLHHDHGVLAAIPLP